MQSVGGNFPAKKILPVFLGRSNNHEIKGYEKQKNTHVQLYVEIKLHFL